MLFTLETTLAVEMETSEVVVSSTSDGISLVASDKVVLTRVWLTSEEAEKLRKMLHLAVKHQEGEHFGSQ